MASAGVCSESVQEDPTGRTLAGEVERERPTYWKSSYRQLNYRAGLQKKTESFSRCAASGTQNNPVFSAIFHFNSFLMSEWWASSTAGPQPPIRVWFLRHAPLSRSPHVIVRSGCKRWLMFSKHALHGLRCRDALLLDQLRKPSRYRYRSEDAQKYRIHDSLHHP